MCNFRSHSWKQLLWYSKNIMAKHHPRSHNGCLGLVWIPIREWWGGFRSFQLLPSATHSSTNSEKLFCLEPGHWNTSNSWILGQQQTYHFYWLPMKKLRHKAYISNPCPCSLWYRTQLWTTYFWHPSLGLPSSTVILTVSPYRMSVFFQVVSLHFLKSSVHLSIKSKKNSILKFCGKGKEHQRMTCNV